MTGAGGSIKGPRGDGFSLVEVIVALGLLSGVLISISGLFVVGDRLVKSGRSHSIALAVGHEIMEEMDGWAFDALCGTFGLSGSSADYTVDTRSSSYGAKWQAELDAELAEAYALVRLQSVTDGGTPPAIGDAEAVRITVTVHWSEGLRVRSVELATVRM